jgi:hypothetical protein
MRFAVLPRGLLAVGVLGGLAFAGMALAPRAENAWAWIQASEDAIALTNLGLKSYLDQDRLRGEIEAALATDDIDLVESFLALAEQQGLAVPADLHQRYASATTTTANARRGAGRFYRGVVGGDAVGGAGLAGVIASDLTGVGDIRDLAREGQKIANGEEPDRLTLGLAAIGLVVTGATIVTLAAAMPARAGVSAIKVAARSGRLSAPLAAGLVRMTRDAVDIEAVATAAAAAGRFDLVAARGAVSGAVHPAGLARLRGVAEDVSTVGRRAGVQGAQDAMAIARDAGEIKRVARLAEARGAGTRAVLKTLGRGAIALGAGVLTLAGWVMAAVGYVWVALLVLIAITRRAARMAWRGAKRLARPGEEPVGIQLARGSFCARMFAPLVFSAK